eukprot:8174287-Pyramimonas_sp.AAC.1
MGVMVNDGLDEVPLLLYLLAAECTDGIDREVSIHHLVHDLGHPGARAASRHDEPLLDVSRQARLLVAGQLVVNARLDELLEQLLRADVTVVVIPCRPPLFRAVPPTTGRRKRIGASRLRRRSMRSRCRSK